MTERNHKLSYFFYNFNSNMYYHRKFDFNLYVTLGYQPSVPLGLDPPFPFSRQSPRRPISPDVKPCFFGWTLFWSPYKVFLQFLYLWRVLIKNPDDATLASLGILSNMQIKSAITKIPFLAIAQSLQTWDKRMKMVSTPRFSGSVVLIRPLPKWSNNLHMHKYAN